MSVDATDCQIYEPIPFSSKWYSHKFRGPGLRYEIGVCIATGHISWVHGPFPCGRYSDVTIFRLGMKQALVRGEKVVADGGYVDESCEKNPTDRSKSNLFHSQARARHETVNRRIKQFAIARQRFCHKLSRHSCCFHAVANLTQLMIERGEPLFDVLCD